MAQLNENRSEPYARNTKEEAELGCPLQQHIMQCFEEGIQAMRLEHKRTEEWMSGLRQEMQKTTSEILVSFQRMESGMAQCHGVLNDVMKKYSPPTEHSQTIVSDVTPVMTVQHASGSMCQREIVSNGTPGELGRYASMQMAGPVQGQSPSRTLIAAYGSIQADMLDKMESDEQRQEEFTKAVESYCACYRDQCVPSLLVRFVHNPKVNNFCGLMTVVFAIAVGIEADLQIRAVLDGKSCPAWIEHVVNFLSVWLIAEVIVRILADGIHFFLDTDWRWNVFDLALAVLTLVDILAVTGSLGFLRMLRTLKLIKALRIARLMTMFHDIHLLIASMLTSLVSLLWAMVLFAMVIYLFSVILVGAASTYVKENEENEGNQAVNDIQGFYASLPQTMYTLLLCVTGGVNWAEAASPVWHVGRVYGWAFLLYVLLCLLGILNVVTSIFVERTSNMRKHDRDFAVSEELHAMEADIEATMGLFHTLTEDGIRHIRAEHLEEILKHKDVIAHFASIGIEISSRAFITHVLGETVDGGVVDIRAFVKGCFALRGGAKQLDAFNIISNVKNVEAMLGQIMHENARVFSMLAQLASTSSPDASPVKTHELSI